MEHSITARALTHPTTWALACVLGTFVFWYAALRQLADFSGTAALMRAQGFIVNPSSVAALLIATQLLGAALVIQGRHALLGAALLTLLSLISIPLSQDWWNMTGSAALQAKLQSATSLSVIGGLISLAILSRFAKASRERVF